MRGQFEYNFGIRLIYKFGQKFELRRLGYEENLVLSMFICIEYYN